MAKSAAQKWDEYLSESRETSSAINEFTKASFENYGNYAYAAGYLESMIKDLIIQLPKAKRAEVRDRFYALAQTQKNELLLKTIKESA
jgi:phage-related tail protein